MKPNSQDDWDILVESLCEAAIWVAANNDDLSLQEREDLVELTSAEIYKRKKENDSIRSK